MSSSIVAGALIADRFRLIRPIGRGGMGEVWLARQVALDVFCAVKFIDAEAASSPELRARFALEAKAAAEVRCANVVQILDTSVFAGRLYIAMEYLQGEDLRTRLAREGVLDARATALIISQAARALGQAYEAGIVHRDLKPANLFLCKEGDQEIVKVVDFGIAKRIDGSPDIHTLPDVIIGSLFYLSPEQVRRNRPIDHRSDLWALGVIAFRCLTGKLPFKSDTPVEVLLQIIGGPIPVPSRIATVPVGFDAWWARAASRDPDHRFQSAKELSDALQKALGLRGHLDPDEPPPTTRLPRWTTTLPTEQSDGAWPSPQPAVAPVALVPSATRAPAASHPGTSSPPVALRVPVARVTSQRLAGARIVAALALMGLGGIAAWHVSPRRAVIPVQASLDPGSPSVPLTLVAPPVAVAAFVAAADTASAAPPAPSASSAPAPSASSAPAGPRALVSRPLVKPLSASSARPHVEPPPAPARFPPPGEPAFDPGI